MMRKLPSRVPLGMHACTWVDLPPAALTNGCPAGWTPAGEMGCLKVTSSSSTTPLTACASEPLAANAKAVKITSYEENMLVYALCGAAANAASAGGCFIGLNDVVTEGMFYWADHTGANEGAKILDYSQGRDKGTFDAKGFVNFLTGQPRVVDQTDDTQANNADHVYIRTTPYSAGSYLSWHFWANSRAQYDARPVMCQYPAACTSDADCEGATPFCNTDNGVCYACNGTDFGRNVDDIDNGCNATQPFCDGDYGSCKECLLDRHCNTTQVCHKGVCENINADGCPAGYSYLCDIGCFRQLPELTGYGYDSPTPADCSFDWPNSIPVKISNTVAQLAVYDVCTHPSKNCWIGANDINYVNTNGNAFRWWDLTATPAYNGPTVSSVGYNNFFSGRPQTSDTPGKNAKNCVWMSQNNGAAGDVGAWTDQKCSSQTVPLICQMAPVVRQDLTIICPDSVAVQQTGVYTTVQLYNPNYVNGTSSKGGVTLTCYTANGTNSTDAEQLALPYPVGEHQTTLCTVSDASGAYDVCEFDVTIAPVCTLSSFDTDLDVADCAAVNSFVIEHTAVLRAFGCLGDVNPDNLTFAIESFLGAATGCVSVAVSESGRRRRSLLQLSQYEYDVVVRIYSATPQERDVILALLQGTSFLDLLEAVFGNLTGFETLADLVQIISYIVASARSDPHFVTQAGVPFDFMGKAGRTYCVLSSHDLAVNVRMMGPGGALVPVAADASGKSNDTRTWMDQLAVVYKGHRVLISAQSPAGTPYTVSHGSITFDEERLDPFANSLTHSSPDGLVVSRVKNRVRVLIPQLATLEVEVVRAAWWEVGKGPGANFLNFQVKEFHGPQAVHGVLGQTLASVQKDGVALEGQAEDYETASIFATNWRFSKYNQL
eukprot:jgi/Mesvir1/18253/Mv09527-RA.3